MGVGGVGDSAFDITYSTKAYAILTGINTTSTEKTITDINEFNLNIEKYNKTNDFRIKFNISMKKKSKR